MKYEDLKDQMQTGDIILFGGQYNISKFIEKVTGCPFSHCGVVVRLDGYDEPLLWEATTLTNLKDVLSDDILEGPKLVNLYERLKQYGQEIVPYVPPTFAYHSINFERPTDIQNHMKLLHKRYHGRTEVSDKQMMWDVILGRVFHKKVDKKEFFCSELVAVTYMALSLLKDNPPYNAYMPKDFTDMNHYAKLIDAEFGNQVSLEV